MIFPISPQMVYVARNAKDVAVSYYYFYQMAKMHPDPGTWEEFLDKFMTGKGESNSYFNDRVPLWKIFLQGDIRFKYKFYIYYKPNMCPTFY